MRRLFNAENGLWQVLGWIGDLVVLSLLWTLCSIPMITAGASTAALYDAVVRDFHRGETAYLRRFFTVFRRELKDSLLPTLFWTAVLWGLFRLLRLFTGTAAGDAAAAAAWGMLVLLMIPVGMACWTFPVLSRFTLSFPMLLGNSVRLAMGNLPRTLAIGAASFGAVWLTLRLAFLPLFLLPALLALFWSWLLEPVFRHYEDGGETETEEARTSAGSDGAEP